MTRGGLHAILLGCALCASGHVGLVGSVGCAGRAIETGAGAPKGESGSSQARTPGDSRASGDARPAGDASPAADAALDPRPAGPSAVVQAIGRTCPADCPLRVPQPEWVEVTFSMGDARDPGHWSGWCDCDDPTTDPTDAACGPPDLARTDVRAGTFVCKLARSGTYHPKVILETGGTATALVREVEVYDRVGGRFDYFSALENEFGKIPPMPPSEVCWNLREHPNAYMRVDGAGPNQPYSSSWYDMTRDDDWQTDAHDNIDVGTFISYKDYFAAIRSACPGELRVAIGGRTDVRAIPPGGECTGGGADDGEHCRNDRDCDVTCGPATHLGFGLGTDGEGNEFQVSYLLRTTRAQRNELIARFERPPVWGDDVPVADAVIGQVHPGEYSHPYCAQRWMCSNDPSRPCVDRDPVTGDSLACSGPSPNCNARALVRCSAFAADLRVPEYRAWSVHRVINTAIDRLELQPTDRVVVNHVNKPGMWSWYAGGDTQNPTRQPCPPIGAQSDWHVWFAFTESGPNLQRCSGQVYDTPYGPGEWEAAVCDMQERLVDEFETRGLTGWRTSSIEAPDTRAAKTWPMSTCPAISNRREPASGERYYLGSRGASLRTPRAPGDLSCVSSVSDSISCAWTDRNAHHYEAAIALRATPPEDCSAGVRSAELERHTFEGLSPGTRYAIVVCPMGGGRHRHNYGMRVRTTATTLP